MHRYCFALLVSIAVSTSAQQNSSEPLLQEPFRTSHCPSPETRETVRNNIEDDVRDRLLIYNYDNQPPCSCGGIIPWRRIAYLNMSDLSQQCPAGWNLVTVANEPVRGCVRGSSSGGCVGVTYPNPRGKPYTRVCGRLLVYMRYRGDAFYSYVTRPSHSRPTLEENYMDGVSVTRGPAGSRQHIWSFVGTLFDSAAQNLPEQRCECSVVSWNFQVPPYVGNNYFCSTPRPGREVSGYYPDNPMFDGVGCPTGLPSYCCSFNNPPWFCTTLPEETTDDLELRICNHRPPNTAGFAVNLVDIYVS